VSVEGADAEHVRELWMSHARFVGEAHIKGGFYLKPIRSAEVLPSTVAVQSGSVTIDSRVAMAHIVGSADLALGRFDPRTVPSVLRLLSLATDASLEIPDVDDLGLLRGGSPVVSGKIAVSRLGLRITNGVLRDGSALQSSAPAMTVRAATRELSGAVGVEAHVEHGRLEARVAVANIETSLSVAAPLLTVGLDSAELALDAPLGDLHAVVDLPDAHLADASRLDDVLGPAAPLRVLGGELRGSVHGDVWRRDPRATGALRVRGALDVATRGLDVRGELALEASVDSLHLESLVASRAHATLLMSSASVARAAVPAEPLVRVAELRAHGDATDYDLANPLQAMQADVEIPTIELFDRDSVRAALSITSTVRLASGRARLGASAQVRVVGSEISAALDAHASRLDIEYPGGHATAAIQAEVRAHGHAGPLADRIIQGTARVVARGIAVSGATIHGGGDARARVDVTRWDLGKETVSGTAELALEQICGAFNPQAAAPDFMAQSLRLRASLTGLQLAHPSLRGVGYELDLTAAQLVDARALNVFLPSTKILAIESGRAYASLHGSGDASGNRAVAEVRLVQGGLVLGETHLVGDFELAARAGERTPGAGDDAAVVDLEGSRLALRHVRVTGASTNTSSWAGDLMVEAGRLRLGVAPRLEADVTLRADDANPILALLFGESLSPLLVSCTRMPTFTAVTHVVVDPRKVVVSDLLASGGNLTVRGTLVLRPGSGAGAEAGADGAFVVHKGPWSVGLDLDSLGTHLRLFALDGWYRARVGELVPLRLTSLARP